MLAALQSGAAVASTGPFLDVSVAGAGPGGLVQSPGAASVNLAINLWMTDWMPVDEVRVIVNGIQTPVTLNGTSMTSISPASLVQAGSDPRLFTATVQVPMPTGGTDAWIVVEAGDSPHRHLRPGHPVAGSGLECHNEGHLPHRRHQSRLRAGDHRRQLHPPRNLTS